jgi:hypothetical protein
MIAHTPQAGWGALDIRLDYFALQWIKSFFTPTVEIDAYPIAKPWGRHLITLAPGTHQLRVWYPYMFFSQSGMAVAFQGLPIYPGMATMVVYDAPFFSFSSGSLAIVGTRPM